VTAGRFGPGRLAATVVLLGIGFLSLRPAVDFDYGWHVANGRHLADGVLLGGRDVYSWTAAGAPWVAHEWLTEVAMAALHDGPGSTVMSVAAALVVTAAFGLVVLRLRRRGFGWPSTLGTAGLGFAASLVSIGVRPQLLELLYLAGTLLALDVWHEGRFGRRGLWLLSAVAGAGWANSHGSFPLLVAVLGLTTAGLLAGRDPRWWEAAVAAAIAALSALLNPWGVALYGFAVQSITSNTTQLLIEEWRPPDLLAPSFLPFSLELVLLGLAAVLAARTALRRRSVGGAAAADWLLAAALVLLAVRSGRHVMLVGVGAAPLLAGALESVGRAVARGVHRIATGRPPRRRGPGEALDARARDALDAAAAVVIALVLAVAAWPLVGPEAQAAATAWRYPTGLLDDLDRAVGERPGARLLNEYTWGGFLIERRPDVPVFIDGRSEVYGDPQLARYASLVRLAPGWPETLAGLGVDLVLMPGEAPLVRELEARGWHELAGDTIGRLLAAPGAGD
jgi:hypothetical protein